MSTDRDGLSQAGAQAARAAERHPSAQLAQHHDEAPELVILTDLAEQARLDRLHAMQDREAAARDRLQAALYRQQAQEYLQRTASDTLTGALHREVGYDRLSQEIDRAHRSGEPLVVAFVDLDNLKQVNDKYGHRAGDEFLSAVGASLREGLRSYDIVVRYGGDEFICALPNTRQVAAARRFASTRMALAARRAGSSISIGLVELCADETLDEVVARADEAMYAGRRASLRSLP
jgi:diguanylate cyclase (GGDEF)-like protein